MLKLESPIEELPGVGEKRKKLLEREGFKKIEDLLYYFPFRYEKTGWIQPISQLEEEKAEIVGIVKSRNFSIRGRYFIFEIELQDHSGKARAVWFNQRYLNKVIFPGTRLYLKGKVQKHNLPTFLNPEFKLLKKSEELTPSVIPIYERVKSLTSGILHGLIRKALEITEIEENLPEAIIKKYYLPSRKESLKGIHCPSPFSSLEELNNFQTPFHNRIRYEEAFAFEASLLYLRKKHSSVRKPRKYFPSPHFVQMLKEVFPFELTEDQKKALDEIFSDLRSQRPMRRLLQGEVGSGKTAVAVLSALLPISNGFQVAFMVPTEILAEQHARRFSAILEKWGIKTVLFTGGVRGKVRRKNIEAIESGEAKLIIGTHALFYEGINFKNLAYVIVDEQQRFGVSQRARLYEKGEKVDFLLMTATPIPRTLALTLFSDLEVSTLKTMPSGRRKVRTKVLKISQFREVLPFIEELLRSNSQGIAVFPVIEKSEKLKVVDLERGSRRLQELLPEFRVKTVHGKMNSSEKEKIVKEFEKGEIDLLVATTVVEVGLDIEKAGFIMVFNAERFGLAQLHQLRGRVGRAGQQAYCFLILGKNAGEKAYSRVKFLESCSDGFEIAKKDLELRGPGSAVGKQQWGIPEFALLHPFKDISILEQAKKDAQEILISNPSAVSNIIKRIEEEKITLG